MDYPRMMSNLKNVSNDVMPKALVKNAGDVIFE